MPDMDTRDPGLNNGPRGQAPRPPRAEDVRPRPDRGTLKISTGSSGATALFGAVAGALTITALVGVLPFTLLYASVIAVGLAVLFQGGALVVRYNDLLSRISKEKNDSEVQMNLGGMSAEMLAGVGAVVLGILALFNIYPMVMAASGGILVGVALILGSKPTARLNSHMARHWGWGDQEVRATEEAVNIGVSSEVFVGVGAAVLCILALFGISPLILTLVAYLALGVVFLLNGTALAARFAMALRRT